MNENTLQNNKLTRAPAVVVGVDGSPGARAALRWALREARLRRSPVRTVHAWTFGYIGGSVEGYPYWGGSIGSYTSLGVDLNDLHRAAEGLLDRALADVEDEAEGIEIERQVTQGPAADVLIQAASPLRSPGRRITRPRRVHGPDARVCQPAMHPSRPLPSRRRPLPLVDGRRPRASCLRAN